MDEILKLFGCICFTLLSMFLTALTVISFIFDWCSSAQAGLGLLLFIDFLLITAAIYNCC